MRLGRPALLLAALATVIPPSAPARAAQLLVPAEYATIQAAVDAAAAGDSVLVGPGTWSDAETRTLALCTGDAPRRAVVFLKAGVAVIATDGPDATTIEPTPAPGDLAYTVTMAGQSGAPALFQGFTVTGAGVGCVTHCNDSRLDLVDCRFNDNDGAGLRIARSDVTVTDCEVSRNRGTKASFGGIVADRGTLTLFRTVLEDNFLVGLRVYSADAVRIEECEFRGHDTAAEVAHCPDLLVRGSLFRANAAALRAVASVPLVEYNVFAANTTTLAFEGSPATVTSNTIHGATGNVTGSAVRSTEAQIGFRNNVVAMCAGSALDGPVAESSCNVLWANDDDYGTWLPPGGTQDLIIDPRFCDPGALDFHVRANSPCIPENRPPGCDGLIGALGEGCPDDGSVIVGLVTDPSGLQVSGDGQARIAPAIFGWLAGSTHTIATTSFQDAGGGVAYLFDTWSDGGAREHTIDVPTAYYTEFAASFLTQYLLSGVVNGGGAVEGGGWRLAGQVDSVTAVAWPGHQFIRWVGQGAGSYTGTANPAVVTMNGAITQTAIFLPDQYMLTMGAGAGGSVMPESGLRDRGSTVTIEAIPDSGYAFDHWGGSGSGSYSGGSNPVTITMNSAITQTAVFESLTPLLTMVAQEGGTVTPGTGPQPLDTPVMIEAIPDPGHVFGYWFGGGIGSYTGPLNPASVTMYGPITQTATFLVGSFPLTMVAHYGGTVTPATGEYPAFEDMQIRAIPDPDHLFREWIGDGEGSYSGTDPIATITLNGPVTQIAEFDRIAQPPEPWIGYELGLSLSGTDPDVHTGPPGAMNVLYLWLECATEGGLTSLQMDVVGSMEPIAFQPAPGVLAGGDARHVDLSADCITGPALLGQFLVVAPEGGSLCIDQTAATPPLTVTGCAPGFVRYEWPRTVRFTGVRTDGGTPCEAGRGCAEPIGGGIPATFTTAPARDGFDVVAPNPFTTEAAVHFSLAESRRVRVSVYDVAGRLVSTVLDDDRPAGPHVVRWPGRDDASRPVPAGVYFLRLDGGTFHETRKVIRLESR